MVNGSEHNGDYAPKPTNISNFFQAISNYILKHFALFVNSYAPLLTISSICAKIGDQEADCLISVVISNTDGLEGINYDSVYTAHTSTLSDNQEIFIELDGNFLEPDGIFNGTD